MLVDGCSGSGLPRRPGLFCSLQLKGSFCNTRRCPSHVKCTWLDPNRFLRRLHDISYALCFDGAIRVANNVINPRTVEALLLLVVQSKDDSTVGTYHGIAVAVVKDIPIANVWCDLTVQAVAMAQHILAATNVDTNSVEELQLRKIAVAWQNGHLDDGDCGLPNYPFSRVLVEVTEQHEVCNHGVMVREKKVNSCRRVRSAAAAAEPRVQILCGHQKRQAAASQPGPRRLSAALPGRGWCSVGGWVAGAVPRVPRRCTSWAHRVWSREASSACPEEEEEEEEEENCGMTGLAMYLGVLCGRAVGAQFKRSRGFYTRGFPRPAYYPVVAHVYSTTGQ